MDALSEALNAVRMTDAIFFNAEFSKPWGFQVAVQRTAPVLAAGTEQLVVPYHLVIEGEALACIDGVASMPLAAGDIVVVPHGEEHTLSSGSPSALIDTEPLFDKILAGDLSVTRLGGGGPATRFICGFFGCERRAEKLFLAGLPPLVKINVRGDATGEWLENSIRYLVSEAGTSRPGHQALLSKMAEALFVETLRRYMEGLPAQQTGWLAGARDPGSAACSRCCTATRPIRGRPTNWRRKSELRVRSSQSGSRVFSASRRTAIWVVGACNWRRACSKPAK